MRLPTSFLRVSFPFTSTGASSTNHLGKLVLQGLTLGSLLSVSQGCQRTSTSATVPATTVTASAQPVASFKPVPVSERVRALLAQMTLEEKIGQMTQLANTTINNTGQQKDITLDSAKLIPLIKQFHVGSFL